MLPLLAMLGLSAAAAPAAAEDTRPLLIRNVTVLTMTERGAIRGGAVLVRGNMISEVGEAGAVTAPENARVIDGRGRYLIPGLIDAHVHLDHPSVLETFAAHGVTTVINMRGFPDVLRWRKEIAAGTRTGPLIFTSGDILESAPGTWEGFSLVTSQAHARALVRKQARAGYDFVKVYHRIRPEHLRAVVDEADKHGLAVVGHAPEGVSLRRAAKLGLANFAHGMELLRGFETSRRAARRARRIARRVRRSGAWVTPNLVYLAALSRQQADPLRILNHPDYGRLHPALRQWFDPQNNPYAAQGAPTGRWNGERLKAVRVLTRELHEKGVPLLAGSDALAAGVFPHISFYEEMAQLNAAGLSPADVLESATVEAGRFIRTKIGARPLVGMIAPGARADLLVVSNDPRRRVLRPDDVREVILAGRPRGAVAGTGQGMGARAAPSALAVTRIEAHLRAGRVKAARTVYDTARAAHPGEILFHRFAFLNLVRPLLFEDGKVTDDRAHLEKAAAAYRMYTDTYPGLHLGHIRLAQALAALGRCGEAEAALDRAADLSPGHPLIAATERACAE